VVQFSKPIRCAGGVAFLARDCRAVLRKFEKQTKEIKR